MSIINNIRYTIQYIRVTIIEYTLYAIDDPKLIWNIPRRFFEEISLYVKYWIAKSTHSSKNTHVRQELFKLNAEMEKGDDLYKPSLIWKDIYEQFDRVLHVEHLSNFKSQRYNSRFADLPPTSQDIYPRFLWIYWNSIKQRDTLNLLNTIHEPKLGGAKTYKIDGKEITHDLLQSFDEFYQMYPHLNSLKNHTVIAELGAGYGRLGYVFLKAMTNNTYVVIDLPGTLVIAQYYLSKVFSNEKILTYQKSKKLKKITKKILSQYRIVFLAPWQLPDVDEKVFDLFINIYSFQEMTVDQIQNYFRLIDLTCCRLFFTKQFTRSYNPKDEIVILKKQYPVYSTWKKIYDRPSTISQDIFEALYKIPSH